ncbi:MAG: hypothetical protein HYS35_06040 [Betaproteobacteria bacterium]|nr:hypothetical protein [Betaproteobacteria bacterium]
MMIRTLIFAASIAIGGCASVPEYAAEGRQVLRNEQGHVIGYKDLLRDRRSGEVSAQVALFTPIRNDAGDVIAYEEQSRGGAIIRDLAGRQIGGRFSDLRSRQTNMRSRGVTIVIGSLDSRRVVAGPAALAQLVASLSAADLRSLR